MTDELADRIQKLEARLQQIEDVEAIIKLKERYCRLSDDVLSGKDCLDELLENFTDDCVMHHSFMSPNSLDNPPTTAEGKDAIRQYILALLPTSRYAVHQVSNPCIEIDGDDGTGRWYIFVFGNAAVDGKDMSWWGYGRYDEEYIRINGEWKIKRYQFSQEWMTQTPAGQRWIDSEESLF